jgi:hypothetical protein
MSYTRNSLFFSNENEEIDFFKKLKKELFFQFLAEEFNVDINLFQSSEFFENQILKFVISHMPNDKKSEFPMDVIGHAKFSVDSECLFVDYFSLNHAQRQTIVEVLNKKYNVEVATLVRGDVIFDDDNTVYFDKIKFFKLAFPEIVAFYRDEIEQQRRNDF